MDIHFSSMPLEELQRLHQKADEDLKAALVQGELSWERIKMKKRLVTDLAIVIEKRRWSGENHTPADRSLRQES